MSNDAAIAAPRAENPLLGILVMILAMAVLNAMDAVSKLLTGDHSGVQVTWARYVFHLLPMLLLAGPTRLKRMVRSHNPTMQILRSAALAVSALCIVLAFSLMPLADAIAVSFLSPLIVVALSGRVLGEHVGPHRWAAVAVGFVGVVIVTWPSGNVIELGAVFALVAALFWAMAMMMTRKLKDDDPWTTLFYTAAGGSVLLSLPVAFFWTAPSATGWGLMAVMGLLGGIAHTFIIHAFRHAGASLLAPYYYTLLIWAVLYGWLIFGDLPDLRVTAGALVITAAGLYAWHRERLGGDAT